MSIALPSTGSIPGHSPRGFPSLDMNRVKNNNTQIFGQGSKAETARNNDGGGFFMTAVDSAQDFPKGKRGSRNLLAKSPSMPVSAMSMYTTFDEKYHTTRSKLLKQQERAKSILLRKYCDAKERSTLAASLEEKQIKAEKVLKKVNKEKMEILKEHMARSEVKIKEQERKRKRLGLDLFEQGKEYDYNIAKKEAHWKAQDE